MWLLSLNPYFRISVFTEPEKFGEFPLKLNICVQQDAPPDISFGICRKDTEPFFVVTSLKKKKKNTLDLSVFQILYFFSI